MSIPKGNWQARDRPAALRCRGRAAIARREWHRPVPVRDGECDRHDLDIKGRKRVADRERVLPAATRFRVGVAVVNGRAEQRRPVDTTEVEVLTVSLAPNGGEVEAGLILVSGNRKARALGHALQSSAGLAPRGVERGILHARRSVAVKTAARRRKFDTRCHSISSPEALRSLRVARCERRKRCLR